MKKFLSIIMILVLVLSISVGCQPQAKDKGPEEAGKATTIVDRTGNEVIIPEEIKTIVSIAPSITEVLVELGLGDKIIAIDTNSVGIEGLAEDIPHIDMMAPDVEQLIALKPDLILASTITMAGEDDPLVQIKDAGISLAYIPTSNSIEEIYEDIEFISKVVKLEDKGEEIINSMKKDIAEFKKIGDTITEKKSVYFEIAAAPNLYSFGKGVFLNEMIELIGASNVLGNENDWMSVSEEAVVSANPDVIITNVNYIENPTDEIKSRDGWENINAIKNNDVYYVDNMSSSLSNHNIIKSLKEMAKFIYPDKY